VWDRAVDGRILRFHLAGLNHQNLLMEDEETGSWWQQITGECILGPLRGKRLRRISSDEVTLAVWRAERPESGIVRFDTRYLAQYPPSDCERGIEKIQTPGGRELVAGIELGIGLNRASAAYPMAALREQSPVNTQIGAQPVLIVVGSDGKSVRSFVRPTVQGQALEFYRRPRNADLVDSATGSVWNFSGFATAGPLAGRALEPIQNTKDYWFDWSRYHPDSTLYRAGR
jgi:hypothetical protein